MKRQSTKRVITYPTRVSRIREVSETQSFVSNKDSTDIFGRQVTLDNGDHFGFWNPDRHLVEMFVAGGTLIYELLKEIHNEGTENENVKIRLGSHQFIVPLAERVNLHMPQKLVDAVTLAMAYAKDIAVARGGDTRNMEETADRMYRWMRGTLLTMSTELEGNFLEINPKTKHNVEESNTPPETGSDNRGAADEGGVPAGGKGRKKVGGTKTGV